MGMWLSRLLEAIQYYNLERYKELEWLVWQARYGRLSDDQARRYMLGLQEWIDQAEKHPNLLRKPPSAEELTNGQQPDFFIGHLENMVRFGLRIRDRPRNIICVGDCGSGKTTLIRRIIREIDQLGEEISIIVLDRKGDYCDLKGPHWVHLSVHDGLRLGLNPPGIPSSIWIPNLCTMFAARAGLIKAWACLARMLEWLVAVLNPQAKEPILFPDFQMILDLAKRAPMTLWSAKPIYEQSLVQSLEAFTYAGKSLFQAFNALDIERCWRRLEHVVNPPV